METNYITDKGKMMDKIERYYIFRETKNNNQTNDKLTAKPNAIFDLVVHEDPYRWRINPSQPDGKLVNRLWGDVHSYCTDRYFPTEDQSLPHRKP